ncbi:MAG: hypothetical protein ISS78_00420 [Phycisphaerae bacterium]|nr:hypothetical protein [Phycisphaerae bacterium]
MPAGWTAVLAGLVAAALAAGCEPLRPTLFDAEALLAARRAVVLPLADAPGAQAVGSGKLLRGIAITQLFETGGMRIIDVPIDKFESMVKSAGYDVQDCYDPTVAAAVARQAGADIAFSGELSHYATQKEYSATAVMVVAGGGTSTRHLVGVSLRVVRASDGKIIYTGTGAAGDMEGYNKALNEACKQSLAALKHLLAQQAAKEAAAKKAAAEKAAAKKAAAEKAAAEKAAAEKAAAKKAAAKKAAAEKAAAEKAAAKKAAVKKK